MIFWRWHQRKIWRNEAALPEHLLRLRLRDGHGGLPVRDLDLHLGTDRVFLHIHLRENRPAK